MSLDHILNVGFSHLDIDGSYSTIPQKKGNILGDLSIDLIKPVSIDDIFTNTNKKKEEKVAKLKNFFFMEHEQIDCILRVIWYCKREFPFGVNTDKILEIIEEYEKFYLFKTKQYILSILNTLSMNEIGILKIYKEENRHAVFDITRFGIEFMDYNLRR